MTEQELKLGKHIEHNGYPAVAMKIDRDVEPAQVIFRYVGMGKVMNQPLDEFLQESRLIAEER